MRNGKTYMRIKKFFMRPEVGNMSVRLMNIFEDNPQLSEFTIRSNLLLLIKSNIF